MQRTIRVSWKKGDECWAVKNSRCHQKTPSWKWSQSISEMLHRSPAFEAMLFKVPGLPGRKSPALESHHTSIQKAAACQTLGWVPEDRDEKDPVCILKEPRGEKHSCPAELNSRALCREAVEGTCVTGGLGFGGRLGVY